jgi:hypothetical protein
VARKAPPKSKRFTPVGKPGPNPTTKGGKRRTTKSGGKKKGRPF